MKALYALVGMKHRGTEALVVTLPAGEPLALIREPTNEHDPNAVQVWARDVHLGFVKGTQARALAAKMDGPSRVLSGCAVRAAIQQEPARWTGRLVAGGDRWPMIEVDE